VRVLEVEARQANLGRAVGDVVAVRVGIEEQVGRVHHPDAAIAAHDGVGHVEAVEEDLVLVVDAVALRRFVNRDDVRAAVVVRRGRRHLVVSGRGSTCRG
jgi:hypothetical protein